MCCPGAAKSFKPARLGRRGREARWALSVSAVADMMVYPAPQTPWAACPVHIFSIVLLCPPRPCDPTHNTAGRGGLIYWLSYSKYHHFPQHLSLWARHSELQPKQGEKGHSSPSVNTIQTCDGTSNKILLKMIPSVELPLRKNPRITRWHLVQFTIVVCGQCQTHPRKGLHWHKFLQMNEHVEMSSWLYLGFGQQYIYRLCSFLIGSVTTEDFPLK